MTLNGKLYLDGKLIREAEVAEYDSKQPFHDRLEKCLVDLCAGLDIPVPLWLKKNTRELGIFKRTFFPREQFIDKVWFDKLEIQLGG